MEDITNPLLIIIAGPTGVGKTKIAVKLARDLDTAVINADSRQIFHEMTIGTALPSKEEQSDVKHYFLADRSIHDGYDASKFETEVVLFLDKWFKNNRFMVMAGGSGLYIDAIYRGIDDLPSVDRKVRLRLRQEYEKNGIGMIREKLRTVDPDYYKIADINNPHRILKALEIFEMTGKSYSSYLTRNVKKRNFNIALIGLDMPRNELHERINKRVDDMMNAGLLDEVRSLINFRNLNALNTVGYKELFEHLDGKYSLDEAVGKIKAHSRQYARRQLTWFRRYPEMRWFHPDDYESISACFIKK